MHGSPHAESSTERVRKEGWLGLQQAGLGITGRPRPGLVQQIVVEPGRDQAVALEGIRHGRQPPRPDLVVGVAEHDAVAPRSPDPGIAYRTRTDAGRGVDDHQAGNPRSELLQDRPTPIRRAVVGDHELPRSRHAFDRREPPTAARSIFSALRQASTTLTRIVSAASDTTSPDSVGGGLPGGSTIRILRRQRTESFVLIYSSDMKVLVTGGAGYIGAITASALERAGHTPVILDSLLSGPAAFVTGRHFYRGDIADRGLLRRIVDEHTDIGATIHLAARVVVSESVTQPYEYYRDNVARSLELFDELRRLGQPARSSSPRPRRCTRRPRTSKCSRPHPPVRSRPTRAASA